MLNFFFLQKLQLIWERLTLIDETFELFGLKRNYYSILIESLLASILWLIGFLSMYTLDVIGNLEDWTLLRSLYCVFRFHWAIHTNTVVDISFAVALRFKLFPLLIVYKDSVFNFKKIVSNYFINLYLYPGCNLAESLLQFFARLMGTIDNR